MDLLHGSQRLTHQQALHRAPVVMTDRPRQPSPLDLTGVAEEKPEESIADEQEIVGDHPDGDSGDIVPEDGAQ